MNTRHSQIPEIGGADANQEATDFSFIQIGEPALAVVMRLQTRLPRIKVASPSQLFGGRQRRRARLADGGGRGAAS